MCACGIFTYRKALGFVSWSEDRDEPEDLPQVYVRAFEEATQ